MVYVYKTNINSQHLVDWLKPLLNSMLFKQKWNFDLEDRDNIFRIDSTNESQVENSIQFITGLGYLCEELKD